MKKLTMILLFACISLANAAEMKTIGWIEQVTIMPENFHLQAKIDTGADNSSIDAVSWESFHKKGEEWIRFNVKNNGNKALILEKPLLKYTKIKRKGAGALTRPVVMMDLCLSGTVFHVPVNLSERPNYKYRMLIGRSLLKGNFLVDSSSKNITADRCDQ